MITLEDTIQLLKTVLRLGPRADTFTAETPLIGALPEMSSIAVVALLTAVEERFGICVDDDEISEEVFETVGSLHAFLSSKSS